METKCSLQPSQEHSTCPHSEPKQTSPHSLRPFLENPFKYYSLADIRVFQVAYFPQASTHMIMITHKQLLYFEEGSSRNLLLREKYVMDRGSILTG